MIVLTKGSTADIVVTLNEKVTLESPYFLIVFKSQTSHETVKFVLPTDVSVDSDRYNHYQILVNTYFSDYPEGFWDFTIYEQESAVNTDVANTTGIVEKGIMKLIAATPFSQDGRTVADEEIFYFNPS